MKKFLHLLFICILFYHFDMDAQNIVGPFEFNTSFTEEFARKLSDGQRDFTNYGLEQASLSLETKSAGLWSDGNLYLHLLYAHGMGPTEKFVGDLMCLSNIEAGNYFGVFEFWYSQKIGNFELLFGQHDMNTEFAGTKYGENFINSSYGIISNLAIDFPVSAYPVAAPCIFLKYILPDNWVLKMATYAGEPGDMASNKFNIHWHIGKNDGFMNFAEIQYTNLMFNQNGIRTSKGIPMGNYKFGIYYHTAKFDSYSVPFEKKKGNYGMYLILDQMIVPKPSNPSEGLAAMFEAGYAPPEYNLITCSIEGGIRYHGILPCRTRDFFGIAFSWSALSKHFRSGHPDRAGYECSLESTYKFQFGSHYAIQPDLQYILNPGAIKTVSRAVVGVIRIQFSL